MTLIWVLPSECHFLMIWSLYKIVETKSVDLKFDKLYCPLATYQHNICILALTMYLPCSIKSWTVLSYAVVLNFAYLLLDTNMKFGS